MGMDCADIDRDGNVDLFIVDMFSPNHLDRMTQVAQLSPVLWPIGLIDNRPQFRRNTLQMNRGDGTFAEIAWHSGVEASDWSWGPIFLDVDLDGYEDILVVNGQLADFQNADMDQQIEATRRSKKLTSTEIANLVRLFPRLLTPNRLFRNRGDLTFEEVGAAWGFNTPGISQGMALADLDNDGDMDVVVNNLNGPAGIYRNDGVAPRIAVCLKGLGANTRGVGATIKVLGGPVPQSQEMICGGRYLSGDDAMRVYAAGNATNRLTIEVIWRGGKRSVIRGALPNRVYEIDEAQAVEVKANAALKPQPIYRDVSEIIQHRHHEEPFDDFERQPLLPNRLSQLGPGVSWHDYDGDGWDDLIIGTGKGGPLAVYHNDGRGGFKAVDEPPLNWPVRRDLTTVLGIESGFIAGSSNYRDGSTNGDASESMMSRGRWPGTASWAGV